MENGYILRPELLLERVEIKYRVFFEERSRRTKHIEPPMSQTIPKLSPEMLIPRMGEYIAQKGLISEDQLQMALAYQQEQIDKGEHYLLGQALIDLLDLNLVPLLQAFRLYLAVSQTEGEACNDSRYDREHPS